MENNTRRNEIIKVFKNVEGGLTLDFKHYETQQEQKMTISHDMEFRPLHLNYVVSMFFIPGTMKAYNNGLWKLDKKDKELVMTKAEELGLYVRPEKENNGPDLLDQPEVMYDKNQMKQFLLMSRSKSIMEIIELGSREQKEALASIARENEKELKGSIVDLVEGELGVSITESDM